MGRLKREYGAVRLIISRRFRIYAVAEVFNQAKSNSCGYDENADMLLNFFGLELMFRS